MIEHYALHDTGNLTDRFGLTQGVPKGVKPRYNISPTQLGSVIVRHDDETELRQMQWGLVPHGAKSTNSVFRYKTFNVASEKVFTKPAWDTAVRQQRCIIPANGFYMWRTQTDTKDAYYFTAADDALLPLAGIYSSWTDADGVEQETYGLLTIEANETMPLPFKRMPVILHTDDESRWLAPDVHDFSTIVRAMRPYEGEPLAYRRVSNDVGSVKIDAPHLIAAVE